MLTALATAAPASEAPASPRSPRSAGGGAAMPLSVPLSVLRAVPRSPRRVAASAHAASPPSSPRRYVFAPGAVAEGAAVLPPFELPPSPSPSRASAAPAPAGAAEASLLDDADESRLCVVCFEPLHPPATPRQAAADAAAAAAANLPPPLRTALPQLPCAHACCAPCLAAHLTLAVPRAARRARVGNAGDATTADTESHSLLVRCPGLCPHDPSAGGWDLRCGTALPAPLLVPFLPAAPAGRSASEQQGSSNGAAASLAPSSLVAAAFSAAYLWARTKPCPHCGAPSERLDGCRFVVCAHCVRDWCWACGSGGPDDCRCAAAFRARLELEEALRDAHAALSRAARWPLASCHVSSGADVAAADIADHVPEPGITRAAAVADVAAAAPAARPPSPPPPPLSAAQLAAAAGRCCLVSLAIPLLALPLYFAFGAFWVLPYAAVSLYDVDAIAVALHAGGRPPHDALESLPHVAHFLLAALAAAFNGAAADGAALEALPAWRQPGSVPARAAKALFLLVFGALFVPPVAALWLAATPLRFASALLTEPHEFVDE